jgi:hypothetical protein
MHEEAGDQIPAVIDDFDNQVETAYTGWPDRMYLIAGGRVLYKNKPGPFGFHPNDLVQHSRKRWALLSSDISLDYSLLRPSNGDV